MESDDSDGYDEIDAQIFEKLNLSKNAMIRESVAEVEASAVISAEEKKTQDFSFKN